MRSRLRAALGRALGVAGMLVVLLAILTLALRAALPYADGLRGQLSARLGEVLGVQVQVGELSLRLRGLSPELVLSDAELRDRQSGEPLLGLRELDVDLDLAASLAARSPRIDGIALVGAEIELHRTPDGRLGIRGLDALRGDDAAALDFFLGEGRFSLVDSTLYWREAFAGMPPLALAVERLDFINRGRAHRVRVAARPVGDPTGRIELLARLAGAPGRPADWSGPIYLDWQWAGLGRLLHPWQPAGLQAAAEHLGGHAWLQLEGGRIAEALTDLRLQGLELSRARRGSDDGIRIGDLTARARWQPRADGWRLQLADLTGFGPPARHRGIDLAFTLRRAADGAARLYGAVGHVDLQPLARVGRLFAATELPEAAAALLARPIDGQLDDVAFRLNLPNDAGPPADWRLRGTLAGLDLPAVGRLPAIDDLTLGFDTGPAHGLVALDGAGTTIDLRPVLAEPTRFTRLRGALGWRLMPAGSIHLWTRGLIADTPHWSSVSRLSLCAHPSGASPFIDLHTQFHDGDGEAVGRYLPVAVMHPRLVDWLHRAIVSGRLESGDLLLRGSLERFPFDDHDGRFILELHVRDGILDYRPPRPLQAGAAAGDARARARARGWPRLEDIVATLRFDDRSLRIDVEQARLLETEVTGGSARLPDLWNPRYLEIEAKGQGPLRDGMRVLAETPLSCRLGGIPHLLDVAGRGGVTLQLDLPLNKALDLRFAGDLLFEHQEGDTPSVALTGSELRLTRLDGRLAFDNSGLSADGIRGVIDEQSLRVDIDSIDDGARTEIAFRGRTPVTELRQRVPSPFWSLADGYLDWQLAADVDNADASEQRLPLDLRLSSDLKGLALDLPAPLGKAAGAARRLSASTQLPGGRGAPSGLATSGPWPLDIALRYGVLGARLELTRASDGEVAPARAAVDAGGLPNDLPNRRGLRIGGRLAELDLGPWLRWAGSHAELLSSAPTTAGDDPALPVLPSQLGVTDLRLGALALRDVQADIQARSDGGWSIRFALAANGGRIELPPAAGDGATTIWLEGLDLAPLAGQPSGQQDRSHGDPRRLGRIELTVDRLRFHDDALGRLHLATEPEPGSLRLRELTLQGPLIDVQGSGGWSTDSTGFEQTRLELKAETSDLGEVLHRLEYYDELKGAPATAQLDLTWPGAPQAFAIQRARGGFEAQLGEGRLAAVDPGLGRMLGVLNVGALQRRLSLDFSDVFDEGLSFDSIDARLLIGSGQARIQELDIRAVPADIRITGTADLIDKDLDQIVRVTPKLGTSFAIAGAVAGGPLVGAAVFLADKASGGAVDRLGRYEYRITGPWRDPQIRRTGSTLLSGGASGSSTETSKDPKANSRDPDANAKPEDDNPFLEGF